MKANELTVGDFFLYKGNVVEIVSIDGGTETVWIDGKKVSALRKIDDLQPIPLTPETLEKNGFKYNPFGTGFYECKTEYGNITCTKILDCWLFYINDNMIPNHFHYLHELQHALKLCGIEKEIVL